MTRWARASNVHKNKKASPWSQLRSGGITDIEARSRRGKSSGTHVWDGGSCSSQQTQPRPFRKRANNKKKLHVWDVVATAAEKVKRKQVRRVKRQNAKRSNMVCFNCRKAGHGLADCPEADNDEELGREICYRCGSTEHDIQRCRAKVDPALGDYPYAKCFICGQTGHLSRSCPDNPKGLYAAGGCCRICGSVEHFQKDCPEHQTSANSITLSRLSNQKSADQEDICVSVKHVLPKRIKVVVF